MLRHDGLDDVNFNAAFTLAFAGFLRLSEITYTPIELRKPEFLSRSVTRSDVVFSDNYPNLPSLEPLLIICGRPITLDRSALLTYAGGFPAR